MAPRQNTPKSKKDKLIKSKIICQRLLTCTCCMGLCTITTDKKKKHTKVMIPVHHNNTKIHGPMGVIKENYRLTCWWWGSNFLHEIKKKKLSIQVITIIFQRFGTSFNRFGNMSPPLHSSDLQNNPVTSSDSQWH